MSLWIVVAFLVLTLVVGIYFSRKKTSFREYAVGNKQFATATLVATVLATHYGGGALVRNVQQVHNLGLYWIIFTILTSLQDCFISSLSVRMGPFMQHLSMAETMGSVYGKYVRIIAALSGIGRSIAVLAIQINVISLVIGMCIGSINSYIITIFATFILIFYSTFGGIRAVAFTDVVQFITFAIIIPLLAWLMFVKTGKPIIEVISILQTQEKFQFRTVSHFDIKLVAVIALFLSRMVSSMEPTNIQRIYMSSSPVQAKKVFLYSSIFSCIISFVITLIGVFVFVGAPDLSIGDVWSYMIANMSPVFKGFLSIALLAMAMSTADSKLNACAVMVSHDILQSIRSGKKTPYAHQLRLARRTTLIVGIVAMLLAFYCRDLLKLLTLCFDLATPIITAPLILAIYGFRGTAQTALIGMATGALAILVWNKWIEPVTGINGSFVAMLANGLAMMAAHYLLKQSEGAGWIKPDNEFKQMQQAHARKKSEQKEAIKNAWANKKITLVKLIPSDATLRLIGLYMITTAILDYWFITPDHIYYAIGQGFIGTLFTSSKTFFSKKSSGWFIGLCWLIGLAIYLPLNLIWHWYHLVDPIFSASLSLTHCALILWVLPLYLGIGVVTTTLLVAIYPISIGLSYPVLSSLFPLFVASLFVWSMTIWFKRKLGSYTTQVLYLKNQEKLREAQLLKASLYDAAMVPANLLRKGKEHGAILDQVVRKIEESISFLDGNTPLYKEDFQSIINKLYDWVAYFNRREKAKKHALLQPTQITLDKLIHKVELALSQEVAEPPRLLVETISADNKKPSPHIVCDINQVVYLLVKAVLRVGKLAAANAPVLKIQLHPTALQFKQADPIHGSPPECIVFQATAFLISQANTDFESLPKVKNLYDDRTYPIGPQGKRECPPSIDLHQETLSSIVGAHYGYLAYPVDKNQPTILLVLPNDVTLIFGKITAKLPIDCLTSEAPITPKEQADSMMELMQFHDYVSKSSHNEDPIDISTISGLLLLLRQHFGFKRHASGQLFYVRAVGITTLVVEWVFHSPKVIYAALLYELVRHTCLPLSYIKAHYNLGVYAFVWNVVGIDKRKNLDHPSLLYVQNRLKEAIKEEHVQLSVLFIKLAERLYDLRHAAGYMHLTEIHHMAHETLTIDVKLAHAYLGPEIEAELKKAAKKALEIGKNRGNHQGKDKVV